MDAPKTYIIFGNADYKGWVWLADYNSLQEAQQYIDEFLKDVPWQYILSKSVKIVGYD